MDMTMTSPFEIQNFGQNTKRSFQEWLIEYEVTIEKLTHIMNTENKHIAQLDSIRSLYADQVDLKSKKIELFNYFEIMCEEFVQSPHWKKDFPQYYEKWKILHDRFSKTLQENAFHLDMAETLNMEILELFTKASQSLQPHKYNNKGSRKPSYTSSALSTFHQSI